MSGTRLPQGPLRPPPPPLLLLLLLLSPGPQDRVVRGDCGPPPQVPNAQPDLNGLSHFPEQSFVTYTCNEGFLKIPGKTDTVTCLAGGQWSEIEEFCGRSCNVPTRLVFASLKKEYITMSFYPVGFTVEYMCRPGFQRNPFLSSKSTCLQNLEWSKVDTFCNKKSCPNPGDIRNGNINITTDILFGSQIFFSCNIGYRLVGADSTFCSVLGKTVGWSDPFPVCTGKSLTSKVPPTVQKPTTVSFPDTKVPSTSQKPTAINVPSTEVSLVSQKPATIYVPATQQAPATRTTMNFHSTRTSTKRKEISTSDAESLLYGHTCVITLTVLLVMLVIIG